MRCQMAREAHPLPARANVLTPEIFGSFSWDDYRYCGHNGPRSSLPGLPVPLRHGTLSLYTPCLRSPRIDYAVRLELHTHRFVVSLSLFRVEFSQSLSLKWSRPMCGEPPGLLMCSLLSVLWREGKRLIRGMGLSVSPDILLLLIYTAQVTAHPMPRVP